MLGRRDDRLRFYEDVQVRQEALGERRERRVSFRLSDLAPDVGVIV
jgi:hypothetical protein